ncbi:VOC family protein [Nonomuraea lactucae]|uniref:VOC family protein n=1 Tax=Nonomuraea lactucae TaxID=2249762 RepID=UPI000DE4704E|nr:VOC family protein [Nonomuraea lactucae]
MTTAHLPQSYYHVGMVVPDLEAAIDRYSEVFGVTFTEPAYTISPYLEDNGRVFTNFRQRQALSQTREPYFELIEATGAGIFGPHNVGRILYYACWEDDMPRRMALLKEQNIGIESVVRMDADSAPIAIITAPDLFGTRIEYADVSTRAYTEEWIRTGKLP